MHISASELKIMQILWREAPLGASDIAGRLRDDTGWSPTTVKTLLARLVEKGALGTESEGRRYLYRPLVVETTYRAGAARQFVEQMFGGRTAPLVAHLAEGDGLSAEDLEELEDLISTLKEDR